ncbi:MAG: hypothetical protein AUF76_12695 [Acidobacteria bacterium 13_1_20CM_2_65_9]|nr:MAG: hypothetical protein AUF76_12695 [Acidobacteria bacterium 13_1_20CM_2_65_9]
MTFLLHGATLTLACFVAVNVLLSALVVWIARREPRTDSPAFWFGLRVLPAAVAAAFVSTVFVPSYWRYEPREFVEGFDVTLTMSALAALVLLGAGAARGVSAWAGLPAFAIDAQAPIMALVGVWRPRLLVTRRLIDALTDEELAASVAHELGHSRAWDNLKRLAMRAAPDLLAPTASARAIERRWASAAEHAADRMCGHATPTVRCALASALVKVARLTPPEPMIAEPISTLIGGGEIASRVRVLLDDGVATPVRRRRPLRWLCAAMALAAIAASYGPLLRTVHELTEVLVYALP